MPMLPFLGDNHRIRLLNMDKHFIWIEKTGECINEFDIGYMINPILHVNIALRDKVVKCMNTIFGALTQPLHYQKNTSVLELLIFHDTIGGKPKRYFRVLICVIYTKIENCVCIDYLYCQSKQLSEIPMDYKYVEKGFNRILGIGTPFLLMNLLLCRGFRRT